MDLVPEEVDSAKAEPVVHASVAAATAIMAVIEQSLRRMVFMRFLL
jgi:hypothetical protein